MSAWSRAWLRARRALPADRRFLRWAVPALVVVVLFTVTGVAGAVVSVTPDEDDFLEPGSGAAIGSRTLVDRLGRHGVAVHRYTDTPTALAAAAAGGRTVLVTAPDFVAPTYLTQLLRLPASDRVVLVAPSATVLVDQRLPVRAAGSRWTTGAVPAGCRAPAAGRAAVLGTRYRPVPAGAGTRCYSGGLVRVGVDGRPELVLLGAADVFRNDRVAEHDNEALATTLLSSRSGVVWLNLHHAETLPDQGRTDERPDPTGTGNPGARSPAPDDYRSGDPASGGRPPVGGSDSGSGNGSGHGSADGEQANPLWTTFPLWLWAVLTQLLLAVVLLAVWKARRLGAPVSEPLPVLVHATETVTGRGRLYHRARARDSAADALRAGALRRLTPLAGTGTASTFGTGSAGAGSASAGSASAGSTAGTGSAGPGNAGAEGLLANLATRSGWPVERVRAALYGPVPSDDDGLHALAAELDELVRRAYDTREGTTGAGTV